MHYREKAKTKPERKEEQACVNASVVYTSRRVGEDRLVPASLLLQYLLELHLLFHPDQTVQQKEPFLGQL